MTLKETIEEVKKWSIVDQVKFLDRITENVVIGIRSILSYEDKVNDRDKLDAIKWLNEFCHRVHNLKFDKKKEISLDDKIERIGQEAKFYASMNKMTGGEIAAIMRSSFDSVIEKGAIKKPNKLKESIFDLITDANFRKRTAMFISEKKLSVLRGFMDGYFYGIDSKEIQLEESEPKFEKFKDWVANYFNWEYSTAGWKNIIIKECGGDENLAVDKFFELYDKFKENKI